MIDSRGKLIITWSTADVKEAARRHGLPPPNEEQQDEVLRLADKYHDANIGINWEVLANILCSVLGL